jgi:hypothetical protein
VFISWNWYNSPSLLKKKLWAHKLAKFYLDYLSWLFSP